MAEFAALLEKFGVLNMLLLSLSWQMIYHIGVEIPGKVFAKLRHINCPTTPPGKRVQTINPPGSEVGPEGLQLGGYPFADEAETIGFKWKRKGRSSKHIPFEWSGP